MNLIAERLRELRESLGNSQDGIAAAVGMSQRTWSDWERESPRQLLWLAKLARRYETSADYLLGLSDDPRPPAGAAEDAVSRQDDTRIVVDSLERLADHVGDEFADELIEFLRLASESDIDALVAFTRALKEIKQRRQKA